MPGPHLESMALGVRALQVSRDLVEVSDSMFRLNCQAARLHRNRSTPKAAQQKYIILAPCPLANEKGMDVRPSRGPQETLEVLKSSNNTCPISSP